MYRRIIVSYSSINKYFSCQSNYFTNYETMPEPNHMPGILYLQSSIVLRCSTQTKISVLFWHVQRKVTTTLKKPLFPFEPFTQWAFPESKRGKNLKKRTNLDSNSSERFFFWNIFLKGFHFSGPKQTTVKVYCIFLFFL